MNISVVNDIYCMLKFMFTHFAVFILFLFLHLTLKDFLYRQSYIMQMITCFCFFSSSPLFIPSCFFSISYYLTRLSSAVLNNGAVVRLYDIVDLMGSASSINY